MTRAKRVRTINSGAAVTLTENKRRILLLMFAGSRVTAIAAATGRSRSTIANTILGVRKQMGLGTDVDLMRECLRRGLVTLDEILALADELRRPHQPGVPPAERKSETQFDAPERE